ncbi:hypothetical protein [Rhodopirellula sp. SWK7]|uniref:hypothetical protein n=1 Tax=Rhodopirellula sp. SWK7 TaxID=595460 RepID=UPI0002BFCEB5|nr:hypothetical protein [Rhodopirellula sp. SWK7]EMI40550.1 hypothetical protein RRSWK_06959 [Rhodopirellula sp. SWK7]
MPNSPKSPLTITEAAQFFDNHSEELLKDYRSIKDLLRNAEITKPVANSNYLHALMLTDLMIEETGHQFRMLTGGAICGFLKTLEDSFTEMLDRFTSSRKRGGSSFARILVVDGSDEHGLLEGLKTRFPEVVDYRFATAPKDAKFKHFIVGDEDMVRDEDFHAPIMQDSPADMIKAEVSFFDPSKAKVFASRFDTFWTAVA